MHTHTSDSLTRIPLVIGYHSAIRSISFIFHSSNFVLLCLNIYLSLPSYVLTSRKFAKWTSRSEPKISINVMVLYTVQSPLFFRKIVENERYRRPSWPGLVWTILKELGTVWESRGPLSWYISIQLQNGSQWRWALDLDDLTEERGLWTVYRCYNWL